jgi:hypothetical protein
MKPQRGLKNFLGPLGTQEALCKGAGPGQDVCSGNARKAPALTSQNLHMQEASVKERGPTAYTETLAETADPLGPGTEFKGHY